MSSSGSARTVDARLSGFATLPWRRIILVVLGATIAFVAVAGAYKTLTLPEGERYSGDFWIDQIVNGLGQGAILALIALGYTLVYGILRMINFAHGEVFMAGAFISFFFADAYLRERVPRLEPVPRAPDPARRRRSPGRPSSRSCWSASPIGPLRNAPRLVPLITAIGASLFIAERVPRVLRTADRTATRCRRCCEGSIEVGGISVAKVQLLVFVTAIVVMVALQLFVSRSRTGRSMRAVAEDSEIASLMGINVDRIVVITFIVGGILAGIAGVLFALTFQQVAVHDGLHARASRRSPPPCSAASAASAAPRSAGSCSGCSRRSARRCC